MPRPTSKGPNMRPDGWPFPPIEYSDSSGWTGAATAMRAVFECVGISPDDLFAGLHPVKYRDILAFEV